MKIDEWPFTLGDFKLLNPKNSDTGWYFCPHDNTQPILVTTDTTTNLESLPLELQYVLIIQEETRTDDH